jgi:hypothetical protein
MKNALFLILYVIVFLGALLGVAWWDRRKRRTRRPLPENVKLLRMPGEHLWRRVTAGDELDVQWFLIALLIPLLVGLGALLVVAHLPASLITNGLAGFVVLFVFSLLLCVRWLEQRLRRRADDYLGFFGERYVAEVLDPLKATGWFIFHDVQCQGATGKFNLDHVAVGLGGVWVIETKTRRKGRARAGFKEQNVAFDGKQVIWPWGEETYSLQQTRNNVEWLRQWLETMTGKEFPVCGVLTFPGYYVTEQKLADVRVVYTKGLKDVVISHGTTVLRPDDVDLIRRQLEEKCRDVEY